MTRLLVTSGCLLFAALVLWAAFHFGVDTGVGQLLLNLGAEIVGISVTVSVVDWFMERSRLQAQAREMAWNTLNAVEHAVWVWQGGPRAAETDVLLGIVHGVGKDDPVPDFTESLFFSIGARSRQSLNRDLRTIQSQPGLLGAIEHFARLDAMREGKGPMSPSKIASILEEGIEALARVLRLPTDRRPSRLIPYRGSSTDEQSARHFGVGINVPAARFVP